ncbi:MAG: cyclase family protein [bacterium]|nr:cyclase family protein [bacterium]
MKYYDLTLSHSDQLALWPQDPPFVRDYIYQLEAGDPVTISRLSFSSHLGTHVDAPLHFYAEGASVDQLDLEILIGPALVVDCGGAQVVDRALIEGLLEGRRPARLLLKTKNSTYLKEPQLRSDWVGLKTDAAQWLVEMGVQFIGIDYLTIGSPQDNMPVHKALLSAPVIIAEGLDLLEVPAGLYQLICLPLKVTGGDGAPARVVLVES